MLSSQLQDAVPYKKLCESIPGKPHYTTVYRWLTSGIRGVVLESWLVGNSRVTSPAAVERFLQRLNSKTAKPSDDKASSRSTAAANALRAIGC